MINTFGFPGDSNFPSLPEQVAVSNSQVDKSQIQSLLDAATLTHSEVSADMGMACAECLAGSLATMADCLNCVKGQLDADIDKRNDLFYKLRQAIAKVVESKSGDAVQAAVMSGIPITEMLPITAAPEDFPQIDTTQTTVTAVATIPTPAVPGLKPDLPNRLPTTPGVTPIPPGSLVTPTIPIVAPVPSQGVIPGFGGRSSVCVNGVPFDLADYMQQVGAVGWRVPNDGVSGQRADELLGDYTLVSVDADGFVRLAKTFNPCVTTNQPSPGNTTPTAPTEPLVLPKQPSHPFCDPAKLSVPGVTQPKLSTNEFRQQLPRPISRIADTIASATIGTARGPVEQALLGALSFPAVGAGFLVDSIANGLVSLAGTTGSILAEGVNGLVGGLVGLVSPTISSAACYSTEFSAFAALNSIPSFLQFFGGMIPVNVTQPNVYAMNYLCPVLIPTGAELNSLRSRGIITDTQWLVGVKANNLCPDWQEKIVDGLQQVPSLGEIQTAWRRGLIDNDTYDYYMQRQGVRNQDDAEVFFRLSEFVPGPSDLVRFMVRDVFDPTVIADQELDAEFTDKFQGQAVEWAQAQGMDADTFRKFWESHWQYPSNTQLYEMLHRLRKDTTVPGTAETAKQVTTDEILKVLGINDISPVWRARLAAISYRPLTRVDVRRAFELGLLDREAVKDSYLDQGYDPTNAERLTQFAETDSLPKRAKRVGNAGATEVLKWYRSRYIDRERATTLLRQSGIKEEYITKFLDTEDARRNADFKKVTSAALKKRFMSGEFSTAEINTQLTNLGFDPANTGEIVYEWTQIRDAKYKAPTVSMLCDWWRRGLIEMSDFSTRVTNLGYSHLDAQRIVQTCLGKRSEQLEKDAERARKEAESKEAKRLRDLKAAQKDAERRLKDASPCRVVKPKCPTPGQPIQNGQPQTAT